MTKPHIKAHSFIPQNINNFLQHHVLHFLLGCNFVLDRNLEMVQHKFKNPSSLISVHFKVQHCYAGRAKKKWAVIFNKKNKMKESYIKVLRYLDQKVSFETKLPNRQW